MASIGLPEIILSLISFLILFCLSNKNGLPRKLPLVGMLPDLFLQVHRIHNWVTDALRKSHSTFHFHGPLFGNMHMLITSDPANIHHIMSSNFPNFPKGREFKQIFDVLGDGIFNSDAESWKNQRKLALALMKHQRFTQFLVKTSQEKVKNGLIPVLEHVCEKGSVLDLQDLFQRFTFDATCMIVTGREPGCLSLEFPRVAFSKALDDAEEAIFYRHVVPETIWKIQRWLDIGEERKLRKAWETLDRVTAEIISEKRREFSIRSVTKNEVGEKGIDLLTSYMSGDDSDDTTESTRSIISEDKFLRDTIINLMLAGRDTTSSALTWFFWLLSKNPLVEETIREELKSGVPEKKETAADQSWKTFSVQELKKLVYLHGALCESLRLYPPVPFQHKSPTKPDTLPSGHRVSPNMKILFSMYAMGRMESIWGEDCMEFKPERWVSERGGIKREPSYKFIAFNAGPRSCIGKEVAFTQMKAVAAAIIHNYDVKVVDGQSFAPSLSIILHMKHGMKVGVVTRISIWESGVRACDFRNFDGFEMCGSG